jgi:hypothetical protein
MYLTERKSFLNFDSDTIIEFLAGTEFSKGGTIETEIVSGKGQGEKESMTFLYCNGEKIIVSKDDQNSIFQDEPLDLFAKLPLGLYRVFWKSGGSSVAAIGMLGNGDRWLAPTNWTKPTEDQDIWAGIEKVELITSE